MRALYEDSVVPVAEIARLVGVTERTLYKWVAKFTWRPRVVRLARGTAGRFAPLAEASRPVATGIMALDPAGAERTARRCVAAGLIASKAAAEAVRAARQRHAEAEAEKAAAEAVKATEARLRAWDAVNRGLERAITMREEAKGDAEQLALAERFLATLAGQAEAIAAGD